MLVRVRVSSFATHYINYVMSFVIVGIIIIIMHDDDDDDDYYYYY